MNRTSCIYCGSESYGKGCMYSPTDTHVHMEVVACSIHMEMFMLRVRNF